MKIAVKKSMIVKPMVDTPSGSLWLSSLDLVFPATYHARCVYFYPSNGAPNFFDTAALKASLSRALVEFYPYAGRLRKDDKGRLEINCNGEGVTFEEAECDAAMDELGDFAPRPDICLVPTVDYSQGISTFPLFIVKLTRFKCGGVSLGVANEHHLADGIATLHFIDTWSAIARGLTGAAIPPWLDRRVLSPCSPPRPRFPHIEHQPPPSLKAPLLDSDETTFSLLRISRDQTSALRQQCKGKYTMYELVAGHVWRCVTIARELPRDQETKLQFPVNAREKLRPPLPRGFFGNGIFYTGAFALCGDLESKPLRFAVEKVHSAIARMDDEYLKSAVDYMELNRDAIVRSDNNVKCPNFGITNWARMPFYEAADFGWGKPVYCGPGALLFEGKSFLMLDPQNQGCFLLAITLHKHHMNRFHHLLYHNSFVLSKI